MEIFPTNKFSFLSEKSSEFCGHCDEYLNIRLEKTWKVRIFFSSLFSRLVCIVSLEIRTCERYLKLDE